MDAFYAAERETQALFSETFEPDVVKTEVIIGKRSALRADKPGDLTFVGAFGSFINTIVDGGTGKFRTVEQLLPPPIKMKKSVKDPKKTYPDQMRFNMRIEDIKPMSTACARRADGQPGWAVLAQVEYFADGLAYLAENYKAAWAAEHDAENAEARRIREFISRTGEIVKEKHYDIAPGDTHKMKIKDNKGNVMRQTRAGTANVPLIQPSTPLTLHNVVPVIWINKMEYTVEEQPLRNGSKQQYSNNPTSPSATAAGSEEGGSGEKRTRKVVRLSVSVTFECKGQVVIDENYDGGMCESEMLHESKDADEHHMVPIESFRDHSAQPATTPYFYLTQQRITRWNNNTPADMKGITLSMAKDPERGDFIMESNDGGVAGTYRRMATVYQWTGRPNTRHKYCAAFKCTAKTRDDIWRCSGIMDASVYADIMMANPKLGVHMFATLWEQPTKNHASNAPEEIRNRPDLANMCGYYVYGVERVVFDWLRYLRMYGLKVSQARVEAEFDNWKTAAKNGRKQMMLHPLDVHQRNPLNEYGVNGVVTAIGNGQLLNPNATTDEEREQGKHHAFSGNAIAFFEGSHDFYVVTGHRMTDEQQARLCGERATHPHEADGFLDSLIEQANAAQHALSYYFFAVRKDAKLAPLRALPTAPPIPPVAATGTKREREEEEDEHPSLPMAVGGGEQEDEVEEDVDDSGGSASSPHKRAHKSEDAE